LAIGIGLQIIILLLEKSFPNIAILGQLRESDVYVEINRFKTAKEIDGISILRMEESLAFYNTPYFIDKIREVLKSNPSVILIDASSIPRIDGTGIYCLLELHEEICYRHNTIICIASSTQNVHSVLKAGGVLEKLGHENIFPTVTDAIRYIREHHLISNNA